MRTAVVTADYDESMWAIVQMASDHMHEVLHRDRPQTQDDLMQCIEVAMCNCFRAGAVWRDMFIESELGGLGGR